MNASQYIHNLAMQFPCLRPKFERSTPDAWDAIKIERISRVWSTGERFAILFVLSVWAGKNGDYPAFDVVDAMGTLTDDNRAPIIAWIANPYFP